MFDSINNENLEKSNKTIVLDTVESSKNKKKLKLNRFQFFILYFFLFAFIGWLMEKI